MGIIAWIVIGLIAGALGKLIMPGDDPGAIIVLPSSVWSAPSWVAS
jgi:uncharacterized membrane protein YeaQ/YmgE (transglycosylase-associated protein family)